MNRKRSARDRYIELVKALGVMTRMGWRFRPECAALELEMRKLAAVLFGPEPELALAKVRMK